jgi:hypothetical protein
LDSISRSEVSACPEKEVELETTAGQTQPLSRGPTPRYIRTAFHGLAEPAKSGIPLARRSRRREMEEKLVEHHEDGSVTEKMSKEDKYKAYLVLKEKYERKFTFRGLIKKVLKGLFYRRKSNGSEPEFSSHKFLGFIMFWFVVSIFVFGGTSLTDEQIMELLKADKELPSRWGEPHYYIMALLGALLGLDGVKSIFKK